MKIGHVLKDRDYFNHFEVIVDDIIKCLSLSLSHTQIFLFLFFI